MFDIHPVYWLMLFYGYCLLGWIWESCYVSMRRHRWINRGFLYGPWLPIYGSGALVILFVTLPFTAYPIAVYLVGMFTATILEYVTGCAMEKLFHMRYWDYSHLRFNLNGHICLSVSLGWGVFSIMLVYLINPPIIDAVQRIPFVVAAIGDAIGSLVFLFDMIVSIRNALDIKQWMEQTMAENRVFATVKEKVMTISDQIKEESESFRQKVADWPQEAMEVKAFIQDQWVNGSKQARAVVYDKVKEWKSNRWEQVKKMTETISEELETQRRTLQQQPKVVEWRQTVQMIKATIRDSKQTTRAVTDRAFGRAMRMVDKYPHVMSRKNQEIVDAIKEMSRFTKK